MLTTCMQEQGINQVEMSAKTGIAVSRINNYIQGNFRTMKPAHLEKIVTALGGPAGSTAPLVEAYLFDLLPEGCRGRIEIKIPGASRAQHWEVPSKGLPEKFATEFADLYRLCASQVKTRQRTAEWIALMRDTLA